MPQERPVLGLGIVRARGHLAAELHNPLIESYPPVRVIEGISFGNIKFFPSISLPDVISSTPISLFDAFGGSPSSQPILSRNILFVVQLIDGHFPCTDKRILKTRAMDLFVLFFRLVEEFSSKWIGHIIGS